MPSSGVAGREGAGRTGFYKPCYRERRTTPTAARRRRFPVRHFQPGGWWRARHPHFRVTCLFSSNNYYRDDKIFSKSWTFQNPTNPANAYCATTASVVAQYRIVTFAALHLLKHLQNQIRLVSHVTLLPTYKKQKLFPLTLFSIIFFHFSQKLIQNHTRLNLL